MAKSTYKPPALKPQTLGPKQIAWLEDKFKFYGVFRAQAEAPTGVAVITPPSREPK